MPPRRRRHVPTVPSQRLTEELRRLRESADLTNDQAVAALQEQGDGRWSAAKLSRIENDKQHVTLPDLRRMLDVYGVKIPSARLWRRWLVAPGRTSGGIATAICPSGSRSFSASKTPRS
ncbi:helix-turn-helix domain-containing protein [Actinomadura scrupuli]|uniref:helix-turn-helix domain-containing protein n=1 Tax=Actinomadura scrupuli TaxID=559629 RepID=UPI003D956BB0